MVVARVRDTWAPFIANPARWAVGGTLAHNLETLPKPAKGLGSSVDDKAR
jgi:hypothetical protein